MATQIRIADAARKWMTSANIRYASYDQVPTLRKQWVFWISWYIFFPIAMLILITEMSTTVRRVRYAPSVSQTVSWPELLAVFCIYEIHSRPLSTERCAV
jgi:hypothetical protein